MFPLHVLVRSVIVFCCALIYVVFVCAFRVCSGVYVFVCCLCDLSCDAICWVGVLVVSVCVVV